MNSEELQLSISHRFKYDTCCLTQNTITGSFMGLIDEENYCYVFDSFALTRFLEKYQVHPITGKKVNSKHIIKLKFHKNDDGNYFCPILLKPFTSYSKLVAYRKSGNVISNEAYQTLNHKPQNFIDLLTDETISKTDVVIIQDPDISSLKWNLKEFYHIKKNLKIGIEQDVSNIRKIDENGLFKKIQDEYHEKADAIKSRFQNIVREKELPKDEQSEIRLSEQSDFETLYPRIRQKGYLKILTNFGPLNIELFCDRAPKACHNFLKLSRSGYYDGTIFHRLVKGFILQGGDPTGTGKGGASAWKHTFKDECHKDLKHSERGMLSMANNGPDSNRSQFFILLKGNWPHLDGKHTVFGKVVGGEQTLCDIESQIEVDDNDRPKTKISIIEIVIYKDPFQELQDKSKKSSDEFQHEQTGEPAMKKFRSGIGVFINPDDQNDHKSDMFVKKSSDIEKHEDLKESMLSKLSAIKPKSKKLSTKFKDFSSW